ncbi:M24 family metallopeptidase [Streptomyces sp. NPDC001663]|uniref:M24 family metallopeptidase n=1 Tax=Streptomyces sp. NPDC001663 TaxID=3364597 RepID=UPI0036B08676
MIYDEETRVAGLLAAQEKAEELFDAMVAHDLIRPGRSEEEVSQDIHALARGIIGKPRYWHARLVRAGINTAAPYDESTPVRVIEEDDIVFCDLGPIFEEWEADFGRTYVLGDDPDKLRLRDSLPQLWESGRRYFEQHPEVTSAELFAFMESQVKARGWELGAGFTGHLVGQFPHDMVPPPDDIHSYIARDSHRPMRRLDDIGRVCHWILEVYVMDRERQFGGFHEQLLDLGHDG